MNDLLWLSGTWFVAASNHALWVSGDKEAPTYTFTVVEHDRAKHLSEEIKYIQDGQAHTIVGENYPEKSNYKSFVWKGNAPNGALELRWEVKLVDETGLWMLTWCEASNGIPEHVHILTKETALGNDIYEKIKKLMSADAILQKHVGSLKKLL